MSFKVRCSLKDKKTVKNLGVFCLVVFLIPSIILSFDIKQVEPIWVIWVFFGGVILGLILLVGGLFTRDQGKRKPF